MEQASAFPRGHLVAGSGRAPSNRSPPHAPAPGASGVGRRGPRRDRHLSTALVDAAPVGGRGHAAGGSDFGQAHAGRGLESPPGRSTSLHSDVQRARGQLDAGACSGGPARNQVAEARESARRIHAGRRRRRLGHGASRGRPHTTIARGPRRRDRTHRGLPGAERRVGRGGGDGGKGRQHHAEVRICAHHRGPERAALTPLGLTGGRRPGSPCRRPAR